jgi:hypothetical protein
MSHYIFSETRRALDAQGAPVAGALRYVYLAQTDTLAPTYSDIDLSPSNTLANPAVSDDSGVFLNGFVPAGVYRVEIHHPRGNILQQLDDIQASEAVPGPEVHCFNTVADLLADDSLSYDPVDGSFLARPLQLIHVTQTGFTYKICPTSATGHDFETAGGIKLAVNPNAEKMDVTAFGAIGDGINDDTSAIRIAVIAGISRGTPVHFPRGTYKTGAMGTVPEGPVMWSGEGHLIASGPSIALISPRGDTHISGLTFEDFMVGFNFDLVPTHSRISLNGLKVKNCGWIQDSGVRVDFQAFLMAPSDAEPVSTLEVNGCLFDGGDFAISYRGPFDHASISGCCFVNLARMGAMLGSNAIDRNSYKFVAVRGNTAMNIIGTSATENEVHAFLAYGDHVEISNNRVDTCHDIHSSTHDSEAIYVKGNSSLVDGNWVRNGGRGDGAITVKGSDKIIVVNNSVQIDDLWSETYGPVSGIFLAGVNDLGRFIVSQNQLYGQFDRGLYLNGAGQAFGNRVHGKCAYGIFALMLGGTAQAGSRLPLSLTDNEVIISGVGSSGLAVRLADGVHSDVVRISRNTITVDPDGNLGISGIQVELYGHTSEPGAHINHLEIEENVTQFHENASTNACIINGNAAFGAYSGTIQTAHLTRNSSEHATNAIRLAVTNAGDVDLLVVDGGTHTDLSSRIASNWHLATKAICSRVTSNRLSQNTGSATIQAGDTSTTVLTGIQDTLHPDQFDQIQVTPTSNTGNADRWWVSNLTAVGFDIECDAAPGSNITFSWRAQNKFAF